MNVKRERRRRAVDRARRRGTPKNRFFVVPDEGVVICRRCGGARRANVTFTNTQGVVRPRNGHQNATCPDCRGLGLVPATGDSAA